MKLPLFGWEWESTLRRRVKETAAPPDPAMPTGPPPEVHAPVALPVVPAPAPERPVIGSILCPCCHHKVTAWRTYADGKKLCLACSSRVA